MRTVVSKLIIDAEIFNYPNRIAAASKAAKSSPTAPEVESELRSDIETILSNYGFESRGQFKMRTNKSHGGYSTYQLYFLVTDNMILQLVVDFRISDHTAKPNYKDAAEDTLARNRKKFGEEIKKEFKVDDFSMEAMDVAFKERDWGIQYRVGGPNDYSTPIEDRDSMLRIVDAKVKKLVDKYANS